MGPALQQRTMSVFQYALKPGGVLFLGKSEAISGYADLFAVRSLPHKIYVRKPAAARAIGSVPCPADRWMAGAAPAPSPVGAPSQPAFDSHSEAERVVLQRYVLPSLIAGPDLHIERFQGETSPFLAHAAGPASFHLLKTVRPEFVVDLRALISQAGRERMTARREGVRYVHDGHPATLTLEVVPLPSPRASSADFLIVFKDALIDTSKGAAGGEEPRSTAGRETKRLEKELASTREYLRSLIAEQDAAQEKMKAANEEILSSNEELQSTNEELETAKEELQSSNEELVSLNDELQHRNTELVQLGDDLNNVLTGVDIPVLVLDSGLRIRRFTPPAQTLFNLIGEYVGRPFSQIQSNLELADWTLLFAEVTKNLRIVEREVRDRNGRWYMLRHAPVQHRREPG